jgi:divalent metal cation (Fe/Co/Zn/Cd) transporter
MDIISNFFNSVVISIVLFVAILMLFGQGILLFDSAAYSVIGFGIIWAFVLAQMLLMFH